LQDKRLFQALKDEIGSERDFTLEREKQSKNGVFLLKEDILKIESELARWAVAIYGVDITA